MQDQDIKKPMNNPLANYFRQPKIYIKLPSHGKFYPEGALDKSQVDEYPVYAMTAKDELMFKTPDALMNGQATVEVIKSCIPAIKDPWSMPSIDLDAALVAIRIATYGEKMEVSANCPNCSHTNEYEVNLVSFLGVLSSTVYESRLPVGELIINIRPYSYKEISKTALKTLEQQKIFNIVNDQTISDEEKIEMFGESFVKLTDLTVDVIVGCIESIESPEGVVTDREMIREFMNNAPSEIFNAVNEYITKLKNQMSLKANDVACSECGHQWSVEVTMDQANFFAVKSQA